jgi:phosphoribosylglycinamide formyltransferase-1
MLSATGSGIGAGPRTVVLISGAGTNLQAIIDAILNDELGINLCAVISDRPAAKGLDRARQAGIPTVTVDYADFKTRDAAERALAAELTTLAPDLVVLAGFMRILPAKLVADFNGRMLNIHPSLLPKYRGLHTYRQVLESGDAWHGSTVHYVTPELDAGPAIIQYRVPIQPDETEASLMARVLPGEYLIYPRAIGWFATGRLALEEDAVWLDGRRLEAPVIVDKI